MKNLFCASIYLFIVPVTAYAVTDSNSGFLLTVRSSNVSAVQSALAKGADVNEPDKDGNTALMFSVMYGFAKMEIVDALLNAGAHVNAQNNDGGTALMWASGQGSGGAGPEAVRALLNRGADPNLKNRFGSTALLYAVNGGRVEIVKALLDKGADATNGGRTLGETPLAMAERNGHPEIVELLKAHGAQDFHFPTGPSIQNSPTMVEEMRPTDVRPSIRLEWLFCQSDSECTSIELGCYYWQPVNKKYVAAMKETHLSACAKSVSAGPRPDSRCTNHLCINAPFTVKYWKVLEPYQKNKLVDDRVKACLRTSDEQTKKQIQEANYAQVFDNYFRQIDTLISQGAFRSDEPLDQAIASAIPCREPPILGKRKI